MEQLLIVEDDIGLNQGLCKALKADARQIISCQDLKAAKEQLLCGGVSLILLDINLPDGSGLELLREVKENTRVHVCEAMKAPVGLLSDRTVLRQQDGGASPRQVRTMRT